MTTNMIRKGLAVGSGVALASTLLVGAPANAAITQINLAPISGSGTGAILGGGFALAATSTGANEDTLTFNVSGHDEVTEVLTKSASVADLIDSGDPLTADALGSDYSALATNTNEAADGESFFFTQAHGANEPYLLAGIGLGEDEVTDTTSLTVFAFVDSNANGIHEPLVDGAKSNSVTITYHAPDEVTYTQSQTVDVVNNDVEVTINPSNVNGASVQQIDGELTSLFNTDTLVNGSSVVTSNVVDTDWNIDDAAFVITDTASSADGNIVTTKVFAGEETTGSQNVRTDTAANAVDAYGDIKVSDSQLFADENASDAFGLRSGDGQVTVTVRVYDEGPESGVEDDVYLAGETVTWEIGGKSSFDSKTEISAGGLTYDTDSTSAIKPTSVTDSTGTASLTISYADLDDSQSFTVDADVLASGIAGPSTVTFTGQDPTSYDVVITDSDTTGSIVRDLNSSITLNLSVRDDFGLAPAASSKAKVSVTGGETTIEQIVTFAGGSGDASMTFTDSTDSEATSNTLTVALENIQASDQLDFVDADGDYGAGAEDFAATLVGQSTIDIVDGLSSVNSVDFAAASSHDYTGTDPATIDEQLSHASAVPMVSVDTRVTGGTADLDATYTTIGNTMSTNAQETLVVSATDVDGLGVEGAAVTLSAADLLFTDEAKQHFGAGSITVHTKSDGTAKVYFGSNVSGTHSVTVTSGGQSDTLRVDIAYANADYAETIEVTSAATAAPASTYTFSAMVLDPNGNGVISAGATGDTGGTLDVSYSGPGLTVGTLPSESTSKGLVSFAILMGANDSGTGTVTLTYTDTTFVPDREVEVEYEITVGDVASTEDVEYGTQKAWTVNQDDGTAKVYVKFPEIDGKLRILHQTGGSGSYDSIYSKTTTSETMDGLRIVEGVGTYVVRTIDLADGTNRIRVSVDGEDIEVNGKDRPARYNE